MPAWQVVNGLSATLTSSVVAGTSANIALSGVPAGWPASPQFVVQVSAVAGTGPFEFWLVTGVSGSTLTSVVRGYDAPPGVAAQGWSAGAAVQIVVDASTLTGAFMRADQATSGVSAALSSFLSAQSVAASGIGAFSGANRFLGSTTAVGPPTTGTYAAGDWGFDSKGAQWYCSVAGTPGTWLYVGGGPYHAEVWMSANQTIATTTATAIAFDTVEADPNGNFTTGAGAKYTVPLPGRYRVSTMALWQNFASGQSSLISVAKNGTAETKRLSDLNLSASVNKGQGGSTVVRCTAAADTLQVTVNQTSGVNATLLGGQALVWATFELVGSL